MVTDKALRQREEVCLHMLRLIGKRPDASQREIAQALGASLGAVNYCIRALLDKGHVKLANFKSSKNKLGYVLRAHARRYHSPGDPREEVHWTKDEGI